MLKSDVPVKRPARFAVRAMNSYYVRSEALTTEFKERKES
jgi:hypothetical protein